MAGLTAFQAWRRSLKDRAPYVRRRVHRHLAARYAALAAALGTGPRLAHEAALDALRLPEPGTCDELCYLVTHQADPVLKPHVRAHATALMDRGVRVVLVVNTEVPAARFALDDPFVQRLSGLLVRENVGFDFAAWAHAHRVVSPHLTARRLYLANDSIVGPLEEAAFDRFLDGLRRAAADVTGVVEAPTPRPHLQSYFLSFNRDAVVRGLEPFFARVLCLPDKGLVVDVYETHLTQRLRQAGLRCAALLPAVDPYGRWDALADAGFPFVKTRALVDHADDPAVGRRVPAHLLASPPARPAHG